MSDESKLLGLLGLLRRGGKIILGSTQCLNGVREENLHLVILDGSTRSNTRKAFKDACSNHGVPLIELQGTDVLGNSVGRPENKVAGIRDERIALQAIRKWDGPEVKALEQD